MNETAAPIIVSALFGDADFAFFNGLRRQHFPPERNVIDAHLTLFHHLPPSIAGELKHRLDAETRDAPQPKARLSGIMSLGRGVAFRIDSPDLAVIRNGLADAFSGLLTPQDQQGWRPHVTIQNKVEPAEAKRLLAELSADFRPRPVDISGIACWYYRGGPWESLSRHMFAR
ncbi:2'-5' RNA ligase family protein [Parasphingopyxis sp.]|uniref:2'-5' RNA ligase family protein n=1 Tax=Parasphingopyxis sp. TaxID=1920299 RepID=UPI00261AB682|nr:2'-5' RNA ligase family protein [Parasphingopyxis sp.]